MSVFLELNITDDDPGLTDGATPRAHRVRPAGVILDVRGAAALTLHGRHLPATAHKSQQQLRELEDWEDCSQYSDHRDIMKQIALSV